MDTNQGQGTKKITIGLITGWVIGILTLLSGVTMLFTNVVSALLLLLVAVVLLPPANKLTKEKLHFSLSGGLKFVVVVVLLIVAGVVGSKNLPTSNTTRDGSQTAPAEKQVKKEVIRVSAVQLSEEYDANKVAADTKYKGKSLEISGVIDSIGKDIVDTPYVTLKGRELSLFGVQCMFSKADEPKLATLSKGRGITLRGEVSGELIGNVLVRDCQIVE